MSYIKTALYAFGLTMLLSPTLISSSYAASGDKYFIITTEELKKEFTSPDFNDYMNVGAVDDGGNDLYHAGKKRFKDFTVIGYENYNSAFKNIELQRSTGLHAVAIPEDKFNSDKVKSLIKKNNLIVLDDPLIVP